MSTTDKVAALYYRYNGNISAIARELNLARSTIQYHIRKRNLSSDDLPLIKGAVDLTPNSIRKLPPPNVVHRYILSSAQNNTFVHTEFWSNLLVYKDYLNNGSDTCEIIVSRFSYDKTAYGVRSVKPGTSLTTEDKEDIWYDPLIQPYTGNTDLPSDIVLAPDLVFCNRANILPTAVDPLSGFEGYYGVKSLVFPHTKLALKSVATSKTEPTKFMYTTGTVTQRNYIQKKEGMKAEFHHCYGALIVEVTSDGRWWCRQINATDAGDFQDLDTIIQNGKIYLGRAEIITWGDIHVAQLNPVIAQSAWGPGGMLDVLLPGEQHMHDVYDMRAQNHHEVNNFHKMYERWLQGFSNVEKELELTKKFFHFSHRDWCDTVVIRSNHDTALERWLSSIDYKKDMANARFYLRAQLAWIDSQHRGDNNWMVLAWAMEDEDALPDCDLPPVRAKFLTEDDSHIVLGIECGLHGHIGPNGAAPSISNFTKLGRKQNIAHFHKATIVDGVYVAGTSADPDFVKGFSAHSYSHIVTYPNGKRAIVTMRADGKWRGLPTA